MSERWIQHEKVVTIIIIEKEISIATQPNPPQRERDRDLKKIRQKAISKEQRQT